MTESKLIPIIQRLDAMKKDESDDVQIRRFHRGSDLVGVVFFHHLSGLFQLKNVKTGELFRFDDMDLLAIELFNLLYQEKYKK